jgi:hypothetical protein
MDLTAVTQIKKYDLSVSKKIINAQLQFIDYFKYVFLMLYEIATYLINPVHSTQKQIIIISCTPQNTCAYSCNYVSIAARP